MKLRVLLLSIPVFALLVSCQIEAQPIEYGSDACSFCKMTIVDKQHAAQLVTAKGKAFKYDSIECMMHDLKNHDTKEALLVVADFADPGSLIDAARASYLVSENIPSPMGANLSAFHQKTDAVKTQSEKGGTILTWKQLSEKY